MTKKKKNKKSKTKPDNIPQEQLVKMILTLTDVRREEVVKILSVLGDVIKKELVKGNSVRIPRVGSFYLKKWRDEKAVINGKEYDTTPRVTYVKASCLRVANMKDLINPNFISAEDKYGAISGDEDYQQEEPDNSEE